jgi:UDP-sugar transporter A1/2/3
MTLLKWTSLTLMLVQNASFVLVMRYSRQRQSLQHAAQYNVSIVVALQEAFKALICFAVLAGQACQGGPLRMLNAAVTPMLRPRNLARIAVPALCFTLQNNVLYVALSNLDPLVFQITYQIKTLLTAFFSVCMLGRSLSRMQWLSQCTLMVGIILVQLNEAKPAPSASAAASSSTVAASSSTVAAAAPASRWALRCARGRGELRLRLRLLRAHPEDPPKC